MAKEWSKMSESAGWLAPQPGFGLTFRYFSSTLDQMSSPYVLGKEPAPSDAIYPTAALSLDTPATERKLELEDKKSASPSLLESGASRAEELLVISWKYKWVALVSRSILACGLDVSPNLPDNGSYLDQLCTGAKAERSEDIEPI